VKFDPNALSFEWRGFAAMAPALLYDLLQFRQAVFVVEQRSPYPDLDGRDRDARHLLAWAEGALAGCLRLIPPMEDAAVRIGRVAVGSARRRQGLARAMMEEALRQCREDHPGCPIKLGAQTYLVPFYRSLGFASVSPSYDDYGVPHIDMVLG